MQRGTCFINYEDFRECFDTYKTETKSSYTIKSSVSVHNHNSTHGTNFRDDIKYTQVNFSCSKLQGNKRKSNEVVCPAFFLLQYNTKLDRLVIKEECSTHIHGKQTNLHISSPTIPPNVTSECGDSDFPSKKICSKNISSYKESSDENLQLDVPCDREEDLSLNVKESSEVDSPQAILPSVQEVLSLDAISRLGDLLKNFQSKDIGSKALLTIWSAHRLDQLCFQTSKMCDLFLKFPESLLIHKAVDKYGYTVYAFLVETKERFGKVINFSFLREVNAAEVSKMLETFKNFNPEWQKVKIIYTDLHIGQRDTIKEAFPSAKVLLSVFHTVRLIEKEIKGSVCFKEWLNKWINDAIHHTNKENLNKLSEQIKYKMDKKLYEDLYTNWFSCELLWYMHMKKGLHSCNTYMDSLGLVIDTITCLLSKDVSTEEKITQFIESAFNSKVLENKRDGSLDFSQTVTKALSRPRARTKSVASEPSPQLALKKSASLSKVKDSLEHLPKVLPSKQRISDKMLHSLRENCNDLGFQLCSREWEVVQKSSQFISVQTTRILVQCLEESHQVSQDGSSCTCYFNTLYKLPCRHVLSMLLANHKLVTRDMVSTRWHKKSINPMTSAKLWDTVFNNSESTEKANERVEMINSLVLEFGHLLRQSEESEIHMRSSTLQMVVDMWQKDSNTDKKGVAVSKVHNLPYKWVKKEPEEAEVNSDSYELLRLDA